MTEFASLRTKANSEGVRQAVRVNQRHLVDKILARYAGESVVWRELIQNSDDAGATAVEVEFRTGANSLVTEAVYRNNGRAFREEDWQRLRSIAEGNPDESKIGFFGVGFYAVFSITEEPMVVSGVNCMVFGWEENALFCRMAAAPADAEGWTSFILPSRDPFAVPKKEEIGRFAASCLTFSRTVRAIRILVDKQCVAELTKTQTDAKSLPADMKKFYGPRSPQNFVSIMSASVQELLVTSTTKIGAENVSDRKKAMAVIATAQSSLGKRTAQQMERVTKKRPPKEVRIALVVETTDAHREISVAASTGTETTSMADEVIPKLGLGRVFIGFPTHQTTGAAVHLSAPLVPTVERESVDFVEPTLALWNSEVLFITGALLRAEYESCMKINDQEFQQELERQKLQVAETKPQDRTDGATDDAAKATEEAKKKPSGNIFGGLLNGLRTLVTESIGVDLKAWNEQEAIDEELRCLTAPERAAVAVMRAHTFVPSTPDKRVGRIVEDGFHASSVTMSVLTTVGCRPASMARIDNEGMQEFVKNCPVVKRAVARACFQLFEALTRRGGLRPLSLREMIQDIEKRTLAPQEAIKLICWWAGYRRRHLESDPLSSQLKNAIVVSAPDRLPFQLGAFDSFVAAKSGIPTHLPMPEDVLPLDFGEMIRLRPRELKDLLWFSALDFNRWAGFACQQVLRDPEKSSMFGDVLLAFNSHFLRLSAAERGQFGSLIRGRIHEVPCVETNQGMKRPGEAYLANVKLFDDLPHIKDANLSRPFLVAIGVRDHVDLSLVFSRLDSLQWDTVALIRYLASQQNSFTKEEWKRLSSTPFLPVRTAASTSIKSLPADQAYLASPELHSIGFPTLEWTDKKPLKMDSQEGRFLSRLGVKEFPPSEDLIRRAAQVGVQNMPLLVEIISYLANHMEDRYRSEYKPERVMLAFLPTVNASGGPSLAVPLQCFTDGNAALLGFSVLDPALVLHAEKLGVKAHPDTNTLVSRVKDHPRCETVESARKVFEYLETRSGAFSTAQWNQLSKIIEIPVADTDRIRWLKPTQVYFQSIEQSARKKTFAMLFEFIDFGSIANKFLRSCGVRDEPSAEELAEEMKASPRDVLKRLGDENKYLALLRELAVNFDTFSPSLRRELEKSAFLVGYRREGAGTLCKASACSLIDDTILQQMFDPLHAPLESALENLYEKLGSKWLSKEVRREYHVPEDGITTDEAKHLKETVLRRAPLLLTDSGGKQHPNVRSDAVKILTKGRFEVLQVDVIQSKLRLQNISKTQVVTCCPKGNLTLLITPQYDMFDVSNALGARLLYRCRLEDALLMATILETPLHALKARGFPVDRLPIDTSPNAPNGPPASSSRGIDMPPAPQTSTGPRVERTSPEKLGTTPASDPHEGFVAILRNMFPDADPAYIRNLLSKSGTDPLREAADKLADGNYPTAPPPKDEKRPETQGSHRNQPDVPAEPPLASTESPRSTPKAPPQVPATLGRHRKPQGVLEKVGKNMWKSLTAGSSSRHGTAPGASSGASTGAIPGPTPGLVGSERSKRPPARKQDIKNTLNEAVAMSRSENRKAVQFPERSVPRTEDAMTNCEITPGENFKLVSPPRKSSPSCLKVFRTGSATEEEVLRVWSSCEVFSQVLLGLGQQVFRIRPEALSVFYGPDEKAIAFNVSGNHAIYFNLASYLRLNHEGLLGNREPYLYWYLIFCHELAHNLVGPHDEVHEFYMQSFVENYFEAFLAYLASRGCL